MTCLSDYAIDRLVAGEPRPGNGEHVEGCAACTERITFRRAERDAFATTAPPLPAPPRRRVAWLAVPAMAAAAAAVFLFLRSPPPSTRSKGAARAAAYVRHDGVVRRAIRGEAVAAGDAVQLVTTLDAPAETAVVGRDGAGHVTVYREPARQPAGSEQPLDFSIILDAVRGEERLIVLTCDAPVALGGFVAALAADAGTVAPPGCVADSFMLVKP